ncbi:MAG: AGE family epimerase/isomerase [Rhodospirillales bacterium]
MVLVDRHGLHPTTGDVIDGLHSNGAAPTMTARLWPQTEMLKAACIRADTTAALRATAAARLAARLTPDGLWQERRDADGNAIRGPAPASSLYHLVGGILTASALG